MMKIIDEIVTELTQKNLLGEIKFITMKRTILESLLDEYEDEFSAELFESDRSSSKADVEEYLGVKIIIDEHQTDTKGYSLFKKD